MIWKTLHLLGFMIAILPGIASAQSIPMTVDLQQPTQFPKGDGPVSFVWQCSVSATGLLEGHFLVSASDGVEKFGQFKSHDLALHTGFHEIPMTLPPIKVNNPFGEIKLKLSFVTEKKRHDFKDEYTLHVGRRFQRAFSVGVCDPFDIAFSPRMKRFMNSLKFDSITPVESNSQTNKLKNLINAHLPNQGSISKQPFSLEAKTYSIQIHPPEFPQLPIDCHQYDVLVITARGFDLLETRHLKAIYQWVRSGGSLCLILDENLKQHQLQFINNILVEQETAQLLLSTDGKVQFNENANVLFQRTGWGRTVFVSTDAIEKEKISTNELAEIPFFLWKLRESQREFYEKEKTWDQLEVARVFLKDLKNKNARDRNAYMITQMLSLNYRPIYTGGSVVTSLMPASMRTVPSWVIVWVLISYVLIIGPGEYFVLGKFRLRRLTWLTFPLISLGFALFAFLISNYYMQSSHERKTLTILDMDAQGKPVKENQIELLFTGSHQNIETPVKSGLLSALNHRELGGLNHYAMYNPNMNLSLVEAPYYSGSIPTQYSVFQMMPQWTPQLNRIIQNYPSEPHTKFDFRTINIDQLIHESGREVLHKQIKSSFGDQAYLLIYNGTSQGKVKKYDYFMSDANKNIQMRYSKAYGLMKSVDHNYPYYVDQNNRKQSFMDDLCVRNQQGLFQIISQTSPAGGNNYEDLSILDPSDPNQWLIVIFVPGDEADTIYRQFVVAESHSSN